MMSAGSVLTFPLRSAARAGGTQLRATPLLLVIGTLTLVACGPRDGDVRIARARAETRMLSANLERLEDRMLASQARVHHWQEMRQRHESVSAIACASQDEHAAEMAMHVLPSSRQALKSVRTPPARIAAAVSGPAKPLIRGSGQK
jgi:hypothetical protein